MSHPPVRMLLREVELESWAIRPRHGNFILRVEMLERTQEYAELTDDCRIGMNPEWDHLCPNCEGHWNYAVNVQHQLELTDEQWERAGPHILKALDVAFGAKADAAGER